MSISIQTSIASSQKSLVTVYLSCSVPLQGQGTLASHFLAGRKSASALIRQAMAVNALGISMRSACKSLWKCILGCTGDQTLRSILLNTWLHIFHLRMPQCLVKQDDSNNFTEAEDPFYEREGETLSAKRLAVHSSFDCTLPIETVSSVKTEMMRR